MINLCLWFLIFLFGSSIGSFLNVVIARLPHPDLSLLGFRSCCLSCRTPIAPYDLIPVLSWFILGGRCRKCAQPISFRYAFVEILMGLFACVVVLQNGLSITSLESFIFISILIAVTFIDLDTWLIPLPLPILLCVSGLAFAFQNPTLFFERLIGMIGGFLFFASFLVVSTWILRSTGRLSLEETAMGWGDPFLIAGIGAHIGYAQLPLMILLACLQGILIFGVCALFGQNIFEAEEGEWKPPKQALPMGPFLALAGIELTIAKPFIFVLSQEFARFL